MQPERKSLIQKIHIAKTQLAMSEDAYRTLLQTETGKLSCTELNLSELRQMLNALCARGFKATPRLKRNSKPFVATHQAQKQLYLDKIEAMILANHLTWGYVQGICQKAFKHDRLQSLTETELHKIVQMLAVYLHKRGQRVK